MRRHILIPTDFSLNAWSAVRYALKLYEKDACTFHLLHSWTFINTGGRTYISPSYIDKLKDASVAQLNEIKEQARAESNNNDHQFESIFSVDYLADALKSATDNFPFDMVVMGTKGATGAAEILLGSNAVTVINKIRTCPVLLIPDGYQFTTLKKIAFSTGLNRSYGNDLTPLKTLAQLHHSKIELLHIMGKEDLNHLQQSNLELLKTQLQSLPHNFSYQPEKGKKEEVIARFIQEFQIDMLAMINYKHNFFEDLLREPVIRKIGYHAIIPFLVIPSET